MNIKAAIYTLFLTFVPLVAVFGQGKSITTESTTSADSLETEERFSAKTDELYFDALVAKRHEDNSRAKTLLKQLVTSRPQMAAGHFELARLYADEKDMESAIASVKKAIALDTGNKWYRETYGNMLAARKEFAEAAEVFARLSAAQPKDAEYPEKAAENYERAGKTEEALKYLDIALQRNIEDEELMLQKMQIFLDAKQYGKAAEVVQQMIKYDPRNGKYYKLLGDLYDNNKMSDKATAIYEQAVKKLPEDVSVQIGMATHSLRKGDTTLYKTWLKKAISNPSIEADLQMELLSAYIQSMPNEADAMADVLPIITDLVKQDPNDALLLAYYGESLEGAGKKDSAAMAYKRSLELKPSTYAVWGRVLGLYLEKPYADSLIKYSEKALRLFPNQAIVHFYNGVGHMNKDENPAAIKAINRALDLQAETDKDVLSLMWSTLGDIYYTTKQYTLSDEAFEKALALDPENANVLNNYSYYLSERKLKLDDAERMAKKAIELRPNEGTYLDTYGWVLYRKGNYQQAKVYIQKAVDAAKESADGTLYNHLGDALFKLNERSKAIEAWKKAKEKGVDDINIDKKISEGKLYE